MKLPRDPDRFWRRVDRSGGPDACWPWTGQKNRNGYGRVNVRERRRGAHIIAFVLSGGVLRRRQIILHTCDNRPCCNPRHHVPGTHLQNMADMDRKGRRVLPTPKSFHRYAPEVVRKIREAIDRDEPARVIVGRFGISLRHFLRIAEAA